MFYYWDCNGVGRLICLFVIYLVTFGLAAQLLAPGVFVSLSAYKRNRRVIFSLGVLSVVEEFLPG